MKVNIPDNIRTALYVLTVLLSPLVGYLAVTGHIGDNEVALFSAYVTAIAALAGLNVPAKAK